MFRGGESARAINALTVAAVFCTGVVPIVLFLFGGWEYYQAPLGTRGYMDAHRLLRPSGAIGLPLGIAGAVAMVCTLPYAVRKRWRPLARFGSLPHWLEVHIFFGIVGPVLVTLHTSFKFNGLISAGYWLMVVVWASGFIGRYLYVRIPKSLRGVELSQEDLQVEMTRLRDAWDSASLPPDARAAIEGFSAAVSPGHGRPPGALDLFFGEIAVRVRLFLMRGRLKASGIDLDVVNAAVAAAASHAMLARRAAHLQRTRRLFSLWHLFHQPLVYVLFVIVALHVGIAIYLGYVRIAV